MQVCAICTNLKETFCEMENNFVKILTDPGRYFYQVWTDLAKGVALMHFLTALWERGQFYSSFRSRFVLMETHLLRSPGMTELDLQEMVPSKIPSKYMI